MNQPTRAMLVVLTAGVVTRIQGAVPDINDGFEGYSLGESFAVSSGGWIAADAGVRVTNDQVHAGSQSVVLLENAGLTNVVGVSGTDLVWTDFRVEPMLGLVPADAPIGTASFISCFDSNGYVVVANAGSWLTCSNDVWGGAVAAVTNGFVHVSVFQDYAASNMAVFVNDRLVLQDVRLTGAGSYSRLGIDNSDGSTWLDEVWIKPGYNSATLVADRNGVGGVDALEVQTYGYAARTLYVGGSTGFPWYATVDEALAVCRPRDTVYMNEGSFSGVLAITQTVNMAGADLTNLAGISVAAGGSLTLNQSVNVSTLAVTGTLNVAAGVLACQTGTVSGTVTVAAGATFSNALSLVVADGGILRFTTVSSRFIAAQAGVDTTGVFDIGDTWPGIVAQSVPFSEEFEGYAAGSRVSSLAFRGWGATSTNAWVTNAKNHTAGGSKSAALFEKTTISNLVATAEQTLWTDFCLLATPGMIPSGAPTGTSSFAACVDTNGWLLVATTNGWLTCSNYFDNTPVPSLPASALSRVTVYQHFSNHVFSVFLDGKLLKDRQPFPCGAVVGTYNRVVMDNTDGTAYMDDVAITPNLPAGLDSDFDGDGSPDGFQIQRFGYMLPLRGSIFLFR